VYVHSTELQTSRFPAAVRAAASSPLPPRCPTRLRLAQTACRPSLSGLFAWLCTYPPGILNTPPRSQNTSAVSLDRKGRKKKKKEVPRSPRVRSAPFPEGRRVGCITSRHFLVSVGSLAANVVGNRLLQPPWEWLSDLSKTQCSWQKSPAGNAAESDWRRRRRRRRRWRAYVCLWSGRRGVTRGYIAEARDGSRGAHVE